MGKLGMAIITTAGIAFLFGCNDRPQKEAVSAKVGKPNIIFVLTDDQRWDALGFAGNTIIKTPNMDKLAQSGVYFKNALVTTPICAASRATILTGLYERTHDFNFGKPKLNNGYMLESYPYLLKKTGYRTGLIGKFGVKVNEGIEDSLFDVSIKTFWPYLREVDGKQVHLADINGNHAIDFIKESKDQPFCLSLSFWSPHADDGAKEQYFWPAYVDSLYVSDHIPVPDTADPKFFEALPEFMKKSMNRKRWYWRYDTPEKFQEMVKGYYRMISGVDSVLGRIRATLEKEGLADNTIIVLMGDNGYYLGERGFAGKWLMHEQSLRVPLVIYDPRQPENLRGKTFDEMVLNLDIAPTLLDYADVGIPESYQGKTLKGFTDGDVEDWRTSAFFEHQREGESLLPKTESFRDETYKFIRYEGAPDFIEFYNFREDVSEVHNLALDPDYAELVELYAKKCDSVIQGLMADRIVGK
ncbi:sulfatase family protein [Zobellia galactanivorans]|uniref:sulfatase family protein n=1 Tax=Zobellia galactanivorans (strain DSM 12802 / CCUG 47099 / CIP 106680 / NCIMB 13871 / Dsij) TaxID=63186 RepID=UPI001C07BE3B|nr:sulfatase [Zobellia galactanivorans]MBU3024163.1 sulfatase [Zobellia galactanivorans]